MHAEPARADDDRQSHLDDLDLARIRLVVSDLDGTLLDGAKRVSRRTVRALEGLRAAGIPFAVASARPLRLIEDVLGTALLGGEAPLVGTVISSNGAARFAAGMAMPDAELVLSVADAASIVRTVRAEWPDAGFGWESGHAFVSDQRFVDLALRQRILRDIGLDPVLELPSDAIHQLVFAVPGHSPRELLVRTTELLDAAHAATDSDGGVIEIACAAADKAAATAAWAEHAGRTLDAVLAFGDETNDIGLLAAAGVGVAMGNARSEVAEHADHRTAANDEDGVAVVIEHLLRQHTASGGDR